MTLGREFIALGAAAGILGSPSLGLDTNVANLNRP